MDRMDHLEHLDRQLVDELAQVARETVRDELREQTRRQRRKAALYAASGTAALYAGAAVSLAVGLALAVVLPGWAAALITAVLLGVVAYLLRGAAREALAMALGADPDYLFARLLHQACNEGLDPESIRRCLREGGKGGADTGGGAPDDDGRGEAPAEREPAEPSAGVPAG